MFSTWKNTLQMESKSFIALNLYYGGLLLLLLDIISQIYVQFDIDMNLPNMYLWLQKC